jgi:hypothetical protein
VVRALLSLGTLVAAAGAAAALITLFFSDIRIFPAVFIVTLVISGVLGLPLYFYLWSKQKVSARNALITGFLVGAVVPAMIVLLGPAADEASIGGSATVVNGRYTLNGWLQNLLFVGLFGVAGSIGGLLFWTLARGREGHVEKPEEQGKELTGKRALVRVSLALLAVAAAFIIPQATKDRSCHNSMRDGRTSIGPVAAFNLRVGYDQWEAVAAEVHWFAREGSWSTLSDVRPNTDFKWFQISLCREPGTNILIIGHDEWKEVSFAVYQPQGGTTWLKPFTELYLHIQRGWPGKIGFTGDQGEAIPAPKWVPQAAEIRPPQGK